MQIIMNSSFAAEGRQLSVSSDFLPYQHPEQAELLNVSKLLTCLGRGLFTEKHVGAITRSGQINENDSFCFCYFRRRIA